MLTDKSPNGRRRRPKELSAGPASTTLLVSTLSTVLRGSNLAGFEGLGCRASIVESVADGRDRVDQRDVECRGPTPTCGALWPMEADAVASARAVAVRPASQADNIAGRNCCSRHPRWSPRRSGLDVQGRRRRLHGHAALPVSDEGAWVCDDPCPPRAADWLFRKSCCCWFWASTVVAPWPPPAACWPGKHRPWPRARGSPLSPSAVSANIACRGRRAPDARGRAESSADGPARRPRRSVVLPSARIPRRSVQACSPGSRVAVACDRAPPSKQPACADAPPSVLASGLTVMARDPASPRCPATGGGRPPARVVTSCARPRFQSPAARRIDERGASAECPRTVFWITTDSATEAPKPRVCPPLPATARQGGGADGSFRSWRQRQVACRRGPLDRGQPSLWSSPALWAVARPLRTGLESPKRAGETGLGFGHFGSPRRALVPRRSRQPPISRRSRTVPVPGTDLPPSENLGNHVRGDDAHGHRKPPRPCRPSRCWSRPQGC